MEKYIALDLGTTTMGVAKNDSLGFIHGVETTRFDKNQYVVARKRVHQLVIELGTKNIVLGLPKHTNGTPCQMGENVLRFKDDLLKEDPTLNIELVDEWLSSVEANRQISDRGMNHEQRKANVDKIAACVFLDTFIRRKANYGK